MKRMVISMILVLGMVALSFMVYNVQAQAGEGCGIGKWEGIPAITLRLPGEQGADVGQEKGNKQKEGKHHCACYKGITVGIGDLEKYHSGEGIGPGVALGYRACQIALAHLYPGEIPLRGDQFVVSGSERDCPADAVTYITGARYGKGAEKAFNGNLVFDETLGAFNFIFVSMSNGKVVKLTSKFQFPKEFIELKEKSKTDPEAKERSFKLTDCLVRKVLTASESEIFEVTAMPECSWKDYKAKYLK